MLCAPFFVKLVAPRKIKSHFLNFLFASLLLPKLNQIRYGFYQSINSSEQD